MNRFHVKALVIGITLLVCPMTVWGIDFPHETGSAKGYTCGTCHVTHKNLGTTGYNNVCLACHKAGDTWAGGRSFDVKDASNFFGNNTTIKTTGLQTSHNWAAVDTNPAAGAEAPLNPRMNTTAQLGKVLCIRCHGIHQSATDPNGGAHYLRGPNDKDQLCLDCHRSRNTTSGVMSGTHPISVGYTSTYRKHPTGYLATPTTNTGNPSASMKLINGQLLCSTCHGTHRTDSASSSYDSYSSGKMVQQSSKAMGLGALLRTDMQGVDAAATVSNICTNCHTKKNHNGAAQNVQCTVCHGGHVSDGVSAPNVWLINRYIDYSSASGSARNKAVFITSTSGSGIGSYKNASGTGICQVCHAIPATQPEHLLTSASKDDCIGCHNHNDGTVAFTGACTDCHGLPPQVNATGKGSNGYAVWSGPPSTSYMSITKAVNEGTSAHFSHAGGGAYYQYTCVQCHKGNNHNGGTFRDVFIDKSGIVASTAGGNPTYNTATLKCSNTYCHSNGAPRNASLVPVLTAVQAGWSSGAKNSIITKAAATRCAKCHAYQPATNAHSRHVTTFGYACEKCHASTVRNGFTVLSSARYAGAHVNGVKDVQFSGTLGSQNLAIGSWTDASATCSTYCHSDGKGGVVPVTPKWVDSTTGTCGDCHLVTTVAAYGGSMLSTKDHFVHFSTSATSYGPMLSQNTITGGNGCSACHTYTSETAATHVNGTVDYAISNCTTNCHKQGVTIANWGAGTVTCESCHTGTLSVIWSITAPNKSQYATRGHGTQLLGGTTAVQCLDCHERNQRHINSNSAIHYTRLNPAYSGSNVNNLCASCHNDSAKVLTASQRNMDTHVTAYDQTANANCTSCHDVHGGRNLFSVYSSLYAPTNPDIAGNGVYKRVNFFNVTSGFVNSTRTGICQICHTKTTHYRNYTSSASRTYTTYAGKAYAGSHPTKNCLSCHSHNTGAFAFKPNGNCDSCHGYPPVASMTGLGKHDNYTSARTEVISGSGGYINGGGAHAVPAHISPTAKWTDGWNACAVCHSGGNTGSPATHVMNMPLNQNKVTILVDPAYKFNNLSSIRYSGPLNGTGTGAQTTGTCSNVSCHFKPSPIWAP